MHDYKNYKINIRYNRARIRSAYHIRMVDVSAGSHMGLAYSAFIKPREGKTAQI